MSQLADVPTIHMCDMSLFFHDNKKKQSMQLKNRKVEYQHESQE